MAVEDTPTTVIPPFDPDRTPESYRGAVETQRKLVPGSKRATGRWKQAG